jgi:3-isopropylmalate/(R)-2-methylmalate dehydratase small subunit
MKFTTLTSKVVLLPINNIDTDQIIPARFLKVTDKNGLGSNLFSDWRYLDNGQPNPEFELNLPENQGRQVLLAGDNFGCGSSREHAPWALAGWGLKAILSTSFADIFRNNALKNGLLPVILEPEAYQLVLKTLTHNPELEVTIDLPSQQVSLPNGQTFTFPIDGFSKTCLVNGVDELGYLLNKQAQIADYEAALA